MANTTTRDVSQAYIKRKVNTLAATHNIVVPQEYQSGNETKTRWLTIGRVIKGQSKNGKETTSVKIDTVPLGWDGWANVYPIENDRKDNRRDETPADADASNELNQGEHTNDSLNDDPIDLSEIPF